MYISKAAYEQHLQPQLELLQQHLADEPIKLLKFKLLDVLPELVILLADGCQQVSWVCILIGVY